MAQQRASGRPISSRLTEAPEPLSHSRIYQLSSPKRHCQRVTPLLGYAEVEPSGRNTVKIYTHGIDLLTREHVSSTNWHRPGSTIQGRSSGWGGSRSSRKWRRHTLRARVTVGWPHALLVQ